MLGPGTRADYSKLERFHYRPGRPATWAGVWTVRYEDFGLGRATGPGSSIQNQRSKIQNPGRVVAVGVLSYPAPTVGARERVFGLEGLAAGERLRFANANLRTISRVIVHPQFRGLGLASRLVRQMCWDCPTRYIEALAVMGWAHPLFERAGMQRVAGEVGRPVYFVARAGLTGRGEPPRDQGHQASVGRV